MSAFNCKTPLYLFVFVRKYVSLVSQLMKGEILCRLVTVFRLNSMCNLYGIHIIKIYGMCTYCYRKLLQGYFMRILEHIWVSAKIVCKKLFT